MKVVKYYQVSGLQLCTMSVLIGLIAAAIITINITVKEYLLLPVVVTANDKCANVINYKNGDAYSCEDVNVILRNFRKQKQ